MTLDDLRTICPHAGDRAQIFLEPLLAAMQEFQIASPRRQAAFLAQAAHESAELLYTRELASGAAYEGRADLGNTQQGDGPRYRGRGLLQITGRSNYAACGTALDLPLLDQPELLERPDGACRSAGWYWITRGLNDLADADHFGAVTRAINGGYTGLDSRLAYWLRARKTLGL